MPTFKRRDQEEFEKAKDLLEAAPSAEMGFVKSLFFGRLKLDSVLPYPSRKPTRRIAPRADQKWNDFSRARSPDQIDGRSGSASVSRAGKLGVRGGGAKSTAAGFSHTAYCACWRDRLALPSRACWWARHSRCLKAWC